ncbi:MarR family winged helix-turn-helix transcriptional regulator [Arenivirga flava]|uniref:HTH marR-type domain-containing protein n=1 Tax=Arenivirga flava TaxID=1930060 RepID=A0AA37XBN6_9MICO|nr:MarR family transcriptional regulator [Arenivirga flava]GMA28530.1 hypothetical protein GCM10025874_17830 [Arenivirga flava]
MTSQSEAAVRAGSYWYGEEDRTRRAISVLNAMRRYRSAEAAMRRRTRSAMGMGETDLLAVQFLLQARRAGRQISPKDLAAELGISSASTTILIDRLVKSGHVEREPHPTDRRALVIVPTLTSDEEVRATLGRMHGRMLEIAESLPPEEAAVIAQFLDRMSDAVDDAETDDAAGH